MTESPRHVKRIYDHLLGLAVCAAVFAALIVAGALTLRVSAAGPTVVTPTPAPFDDMLSVGRWAALQPELERLPRRWIITHTIAAHRPLAREFWPRRRTWLPSPVDIIVHLLMYVNTSVAESQEQRFLSREVTPFCQAGQVVL